MAPSWDFVYHVLDFFYDDEDSCALTVMCENVRYHVIADKDKIGKGRVGKQYNRLLKAVKVANGDEKTGETEDSGVDVSHGKVEKQEASKVESNADELAEENLHRWMLEPVRSTISYDAEAPPSITLHDFYQAPTHFFELESTKNDHLHAAELEHSTEMQHRMTKLLPQISIPKYIQNIPQTPWFASTDLTILSYTASPPPYHPTRVRTPDDKIFFLKLVDPQQPQPTKREIPLLKRIADEKINEEIRCPVLEGLVTFETSRTKLLGFLQTDIPSPTPLTSKLDSNIPQSLREKWAEESHRMKEVLHKHKIIWGDAKADNFMVDKNERLWIIDFGGSYTEGWVDEEVRETVGGDDMGVEKIVNALFDPEKNTWDPDVEKSFGGTRTGEDGEVDDGDDESEVEGDRSGRKRKVEDGGEGGEGGELESDDADEVERKAGGKRQKTDTVEEKRYCLCDQPSSGRMVGCDGEKCEREWFHFECVGLSGPPGEDEQWFCDECQPTECGTAWNQ